jgi:hypothetical protein
VVPPSLVATIAPSSPTAKQVITLGQLMLFSGLGEKNTRDHVAPSFVVGGDIAAGVDGKTRGRRRATDALRGEGPARASLRGPIASSRVGAENGAKIPAGEAGGRCRTADCVQRVPLDKRVLPYPRPAFDRRGRGHAGDGDQSWLQNANGAQDNGEQKASTSQTPTVRVPA